MAESKGKSKKKKNESKTILIWEGPERPHKKQDRKFYSSMISLAIVISIFLFFAGQFILILVLLSMLFATYALYSTPPKNTAYILTNRGIELGDEKIGWSQIESYFITRRLDEMVINIDLKEGLMKRRYLIPDSPETMERAEEIIEEHVEEKEFPKEKGNFRKVLEKLGLSLGEE